jgi:endonuclease-8
MEGPSLHLAAAQLKPFKKKVVIAVSGNTKIGKERMDGKEAVDIFAWGKHLVIQFDSFALRTHFLLYGTFEAQVDGTWVTGDYRRAREPRLSLSFPNGMINMYNCSVRFIENAHAKRGYDYSIDIMSPKWDSEKALRALKEASSEEIADLLLDQEVFAGVGNIIKNEVLSIARVNPEATVGMLTPQKRRLIVEQARAYSAQFLKWRKKFELRTHLAVHRRSACPHCGTKLIRRKTGKRERWSYWCAICQAMPALRVPAAA